MKLFGKEYGMLYSVGAQDEIAELCPERDIKRLGEVFTGTGPTPDRNEESAKVPIILSEWHERAQAVRASAEGQDYKEQPLTYDLIQLLSVEEFGQLMTEAFAAMGAGRSRTVEEEPPGDEKKTEAAAG